MEVTLVKLSNVITAADLDLQSSNLTIHFMGGDLDTSGSNLTFPIALSTYIHH